MSATELTPERQIAVINGFLDMMLIIQQRQIAIPERARNRIQAAWNCIKLPEMRSELFTNIQPSARSNLVLPVSETTRLPHVSREMQYKLAADITGR